MYDDAGLYRVVWCRAVHERSSPHWPMLLDSTMLAPVNSASVHTMLLQQNERATNTREQDVSHVVIRPLGTARAFVLELCGPTGQTRATRHCHDHRGLVAKPSLRQLRTHPNFACLTADRREALTRLTCTQNISNVCHDRAACGPVLTAGRFEPDRIQCTAERCGACNHHTVLPDPVNTMPTAAERREASALLPVSPQAPTSSA